MLSVLHTADVHIDQGRVSTTPPVGMPTAWESADRVWMGVCEQAVELAVDAFVVSGDLFNNGLPAHEAVERIADGLRLVAQAGVPVVVQPGNHELIRLRRGYRTAVHRFSDIPGVTVFEQPGWVTLPSGLQVVVMPWPSRSAVTEDHDAADLTGPEIDDLAAKLAMETIYRLADELDSSLPSLLMAHATIAGTKVHGKTVVGALDVPEVGSEKELAAVFSEPILSLNGIEEGPWSYVALGHIHRRQRLGTRSWYPGSPETIDFSEANDPKTVNLVSIGAAGAAGAVTHLPTLARRLVVLDAETPMSAAVTKKLDGAIVKVVIAPDAKAADPALLAAVADAGGTVAQVKKAVVKPAKPVDGTTDAAGVVTYLTGGEPTEALLERWHQRRPADGVSFADLVTAYKEIVAA